MTMLNLKSITMKKANLIVAFIALTIGATYAQESHSLTLTIENIESSEGQLLVGLFNSQETFLNTAFKRVTVKATKGVMEVKFDDVPTGTYAVSVVHDLNSNNALDKNMMGIPSEPYGVSKDGKSMFGPPSYNGAKFDVANQDIALNIQL